MTLPFQKLVSSDQNVFLGLLRDLFPGVALDTAMRDDTKLLVRQAATKSGLQAADKFCYKVLQLQEMLSIRQSVFIVGGSKTGKTANLENI